VTSESDAGIRLQKVLAQAGVGSRRACEQLIEEGRVSVNGKAVREQGMRVDPNRDAIHVDGTRVPTAEETLVLAVNKPIGMVSTMSDERGRPCVGDLVFDRPERLFHVGRLDIDTEGLILLTNDGDLAQHLAHPSHGVPKTYVATLLGIVPRDLGRRMKAGLELEDGMARVDEFRLVSSTPGRAMIEVTLHEGRKHIVRRLFAEAGHPVESLVRVRIGPIMLGQMRPGTVRTLHGPELGSLYSSVGL
jgi:23S rRNA pseudouridine2605 synthase